MVDVGGKPETRRVAVAEGKVSLSAEAYRRLRRNEIEKGPGGKQIQLEDPDGNPIELFEPAK